MFLNLIRRFYGAVLWHQTMQQCISNLNASLHGWMMNFETLIEKKNYDFAFEAFFSFCARFTFITQPNRNVNEARVIVLKLPIEMHVTFIIQNIFRYSIYFQCFWQTHELDNRQIMNEDETQKLDSTWPIDATLTPEIALNLFEQTIGWEMENCLNWDFLSLKRLFVWSFFFAFVQRLGYL